MVTSTPPGSSRSARGDRSTENGPSGSALTVALHRVGRGIPATVGQRSDLCNRRGGVVSRREFDGLAALVTGGGSGIGLATAVLLGQRGARVAVVDLEPSGAPDPLLRVSGDVSDERSVEAAVDAVVARFGRLDVLVNNAGIGAAGTVEANALEEWRRVLDVNVLGIVRSTRAALPHLRRSPCAAVVNTCSVAAWAGLPERALYSASKGAVQALTFAMAADHEGERAALEARQPLGRLVTAAEVAHAIAYLASPLAAATTGTVLAVDGGMAGLRLRPPGSVPDKQGPDRKEPG